MRQQKTGKKSRSSKPNSWLTINNEMTVIRNYSSSRRKLWGLILNLIRKLELNLLSQRLRLLKIGKNRVQILLKDSSTRKYIKKKQQRRRHSKTFQNHQLCKNSKANHQISKKNRMKAELGLLRQTTSNREAQSQSQIHDPCLYLSSRKFHSFL